MSNFVCRYSINDSLNEADKSLVIEAMMYHPRKDAKIGIGIKEIKVMQVLLYAFNFILLEFDVALHCLLNSIFIR